MLDAERLSQYTVLSPLKGEDERRPEITLHQGEISYLYENNQTIPSEVLKGQLKSLRE